MRTKLTRTLLAGLALAILVTGLAAAAAGVEIYRNEMTEFERRSDFRKVGGRKCKRGGSPKALRVELGRRTAECVYRTPVVGRDLEIIVTERLLSPTPRKMRRRIFLSVSLRSGKGLGRYQLKVFPIQRKYQLLKYVPGQGIRYLAVGKNISAIKGTNKGNRVRLRAFNMGRTRDRNDARLLVYVNGKRLAVYRDPRAGQLEGRETLFSVGSKRRARTAMGSFDNVIIRIPNPF